MLREHLKFLSDRSSGLTNCLGALCFASKARGKRSDDPEWKGVIPSPGLVLSVVHPGTITATPASLGCLVCKNRDAKRSSLLGRPQDYLCTYFVSSCRKRGHCFLTIAILTRTIDHCRLDISCGNCPEQRIVGRCIAFWLTSTHYF